MIDYPACLREEAEVAEFDGLPDTACMLKDAADEIDRLQDEKEGLVYMASSSGLGSRQLPRYRKLREDVKRLQAIVDASAALRGEVLLMADRLLKSESQFDRALGNAWMKLLGKIEAAEAGKEGQA